MLSGVSSAFPDVLRFAFTLASSRAMLSGVKLSSASLRSCILLGRYVCAVLLAVIFLCASATRAFALSTLACAFSSGVGSFVMARVGAGVLATGTGASGRVALCVSAAIGACAWITGSGAAASVCGLTDSCLATAWWAGAACLY